MNSYEKLIGSSIRVIGAKELALGLGLKTLKNLNSIIIDL